MYTKPVLAIHCGISVFTCCTYLYIYVYVYASTRNNILNKIIKKTFMYVCLYYNQLAVV